MRARTAAAGARRSRRGRPAPRPGWPRSAAARPRRPIAMPCAAQRSRSSRTSASISSSAGQRGSGTPRVPGHAAAARGCRRRSSSGRRRARRPPSAARAAGASRGRSPRAAAGAVPARLPRRRSRRGSSRSRGRAAAGCRAPRRGCRPGAGRPARRLHDIQRAVDAGQGLAVGVSGHVAAPAPELGGTVAHRREHQVGLLPVEPAPGEDAPRLDEQHLLGGVVQEVRAELVTEQPASPGHGASVGARDRARSVGVGGPRGRRTRCCGRSRPGVRAARPRVREYGGRDL